MSLKIPDTAMEKTQNVICTTSDSFCLIASHILKTILKAYGIVLFFFYKHLFNIFDEFTKEWVFLFHRAINYDEKDPFLCNACGFCKYAKFDYTLTARACCAVDPIETEDDRKKVRFLWHLVNENVCNSVKLICYTLLPFKSSKLIVCIGAWYDFVQERKHP